MSQSQDSFASKCTIDVGEKVEVFRLDALEKAGVGKLSRLPYSLRILLENLLRHEDGVTVTADDIKAVASWNPAAKPSVEVAYRPSRIVLQDFTGVPAVVDIAAMREAFAEMGGDAAAMNPVRPADLVIDHSVQVDSHGELTSFGKNVAREYERNKERYQFLRWGQQAFSGLRVVPPGTGIVHQVNLEYLAPLVFFEEQEGVMRAFPDSLVGTDSHTTMINGLGVLGWGVGGIEAEAAALGQPIAMLVPQVVGFELKGQLPEGATATDLVLTVVEMLREKGVVGKFVEFYGDGLAAMSLPDRATIANMAPEYGATMGFFPVDEETLNYMRFTGRGSKHVDRVERYLKEQHLFHDSDSPVPDFTDTLSLDLSTVVPSIAGPKRPQDRIELRSAARAWRRTLVSLLGPSTLDPSDSNVADWLEASGESPAPGPVNTSQTVETDKGTFDLNHGDVVIAAITSCTNTSNPAVMLAAGLLARNAHARGLTAAPWVKTSLAPGSQVVTEYLESAKLMIHLQHLGFHLVGYGCTTCIGNSGPVAPEIAAAVNDHDLVVTSVLSGNRNFEGRISPVVKANYLASPPLVVAYAIAGSMNVDFEKDALGQDQEGKEVYLRDIWPSPEELRNCLRDAVKSKQFEERYAEVFEGTQEWSSLDVPGGATFAWDDSSTYIRKPTFFDNLGTDAPPLANIEAARVLALLGDSVTTDHISPAGAIAPDSPAGRYLQDKGVAPRDFNSYGSRRGNHEVMMRGTFANIRLRNLLAPGTEGGITRHLPSGEQTTIYEASMRYQQEGTPLIVVAGTEYGTGSSRDWAAKGTLLLGVKAVIAASYERIHRSNLVGMGVLPLQFVDGQDRESLGLTGEEVFTIDGISAGLTPQQRLTVCADNNSFEVLVRIDSPQEVEYYRHGGILQYVLRSRGSD